VPLIDWPPAATIADIAGGIAAVLAAVLRAAPGTRGILVDQPDVLERAGPSPSAQVRSSPSGEPA
jgi:O-methyltransferase